jgi:hypothetical protein
MKTGIMKKQVINNITSKGTFNKEKEMNHLETTTL